MSSGLDTAGSLPAAQVSGDRTARLAGIVYLSFLPTMGLGVFSAQPLLANGASGAAVQIAESRSFLELGVLAGAAGAVTWLVLGVLFYALFRPASDRACKLLFAMIIAASTLLLAALARRMDALALVAESQASGFGADELRAVVASTVRSSDHLMQISLIFSGFWLLPLGFLVYRSGFLPKTIGVLLMLGAPFYIAPFVGTVLGVEYAKTTVAQVIGFACGLPGTVGELGLGLWLVIRGAKGARRAVSEKIEVRA